MGYDCSRLVGSGAVLHWTAGTAQPPSNPCTGTVPPLPANTTAPTDMVHMAFELTTSSAWVGLSYKMQGKGMAPADAVLGWFDPSGRAVVGTYFLTEADVRPTDRTVVQWATNTGLYRVGNKVTLCFSRPAAVVVHTDHRAGSNASTPLSGTGGHVHHRRRLHQAAQGGMGVSRDLDLTQMVRYNYAFGPIVDGFLDRKKQHDGVGAFELNMATNEGSGGGTSEDERWANTHGILMSVAFALLMPIATLAVRHRMLWPDKEVGSKKVWFLVHAGGQFCALVFLIAGISIAFVQWEDTWEVSLKEGLGGAHRILGITVLSLVSFQFVMGLLRPGPDHRLRWLFNIAHFTSGFTTLLLSWATLYTGVVLYRERFISITAEVDTHYKAFVGCLVAAMSLVVVAELVLDLMRWRQRESSQHQPLPEFKGQAEMEGGVKG